VTAQLSCTTPIIIIDLLSINYSLFAFNLIQVKKVMNIVYRRIRSEFSPDIEYQSSDIDAVVLSVIKVLLREHLAVVVVILQIY